MCLGCPGEIGSRPDFSSEQGCCAPQTNNPQPPSRGHWHRKQGAEGRQEPRPHPHIPETGRSLGIWIEAPAGKTGRVVEKTAAHRAPGLGPHPLEVAPWVWVAWGSDQRVVGLSAPNGRAVSECHCYCWYNYHSPALSPGFLPCHHHPHLLIPGCGSSPPRAPRAESPSIPVKSVGGRVRRGPGAREDWVRVPALPLISQ